MRRDVCPGFHLGLVWILCVSSTQTPVLGLEPPRITDGPPREVIYFADKLNRRLNCSATGDPAPTYKWKRNGEILKNETSKFIEIGVNRILQTGKYQCVASNTYGTAISNITTAIKAVAESKDEVIEEAIAGQGFALPCRASAIPSEDFYWAKDLSDGDYDFLADTPQHTVLKTDGSLHFARVTQTDAGKYRCYVVSPFSQNYHYGDVTLKVKPSQGEEKPSNLTIAYSSPPRVILAGSKVVLQCIFYGDTNITIKWTKGGKKVLKNGTTWESVALDDSGRYKCRAEGKHGTAQAYVHLNVTKPVHVGDELSPVVTQKGTEAMFSCDVPGQVHTDWFINGEQLQVAGSMPGFEVTGSRLRIQTATVDKKTMTVTCNITDGHSSYDIADTFLIIRDIPTTDPRYKGVEPTKGPGPGNMSSLVVIVIAIVIFIIVCGFGVLVACMIRELRRSSQAQNAARSSTENKTLQKTENTEEEANKENERRRQGQEECPLMKANSKENNSPIIIVVQQPLQQQPQEDAGDNGEDSGRRLVLRPDVLIPCKIYGNVYLCPKEHNVYHTL